MGVWKGGGVERREREVWKGGVGRRERGMWKGGGVERGGGVEGARWVEERPVFGREGGVSEGGVSKGGVSEGGVSEGGVSEGGVRGRRRRPCSPARPLPLGRAQTARAPARGDMGRGTTPPG